MATEEDKEPAEIPEKAKLDTSSAEKTPKVAKKPTPGEEPVQYPSLLVPLLEIRDDPNKVVEDLSGTFIDDKHSPDGEEAYGDNTHGNQELMQVCPIRKEPF